MMSYNVYTGFFGADHMNKIRKIKTLTLVIFLLFVFSSFVSAQRSMVYFPIEKTQLNQQSLYFIETADIQQTQLYADGSILEVETEILTRPILGDTTTTLSSEQFQQYVKRSREKQTLDTKTILLDTTSQNGLTLQFTINNAPPGAIDAINEVKTYFEHLFFDPITAYISITFQNDGSGYLGYASTNNAIISYTNARNGLINGMDPDDIIQNYLPTGNSIPVRYNINTGTITQKYFIRFSTANYRSTIGSLSGPDSQIVINTHYSWDYDPSNGVPTNTFCFQSVLSHEIGHALGFISGVDFQSDDIWALDMFRFQMTNYNPSTYLEFQSFPRLNWKDTAGVSNDDCVSNIITAQWRMSDGNPYQASHFSQGNVYAIMQPAISSGFTYYPDFFKTPDKAMLDAIGWDYYPLYTLDVTVQPLGTGTVILNPDEPYYIPNQQVQLTAIQEQGYQFSHWSGDISETTNPITINMNADKTVTAHFTIINNPPYNPCCPTPEHQAVDISIEPLLTWIGGDPDPEDTVTYDVYFGTTIPPPLQSSQQLQTSFSPGILDYDTTYYWGVVAWDNHGAYAASEIWSFTTQQNPYLTMTRLLHPGWNYVSFNVTPDDTLMSSIIQPLVDQGVFVVVHDGATGVLWPAYNIDTIGHMDITKGYRIYVNQPATLSTTGLRILLPQTLNLLEGWNLIGCPFDQPRNALDVLQPLINDDVLIYVKDQNDNAIYYQESTLVNDIGDFTPSYAYFVKVSSDTTLVIPAI